MTKEIQAGTPLLRSYDTFPCHHPWTPEKRKQTICSVKDVGDARGEGPLSFETGSLSLEQCHRMPPESFFLLSFWTKEGPDCFLCKGHEDLSNLDKNPEVARSLDLDLAQRTGPSPPRHESL